MRAGKILSIIAGIITFLSIYVFTWYLYIDWPTIYYAWGGGLIKNLPYLFTNASSIGAGLGIPGWVVYFIVIGFIVLLTSPFLLFLGIKRRSTEIIGGIFPILFAITLIIVNTGVFPQISRALYFTWDAAPLIEGILPLYISPTFQIVQTYLMFAGGAIGVIGGCLGRD